MGKNKRRSDQRSDLIESNTKKSLTGLTRTAPTQREIPHTRIHVYTNFSISLSLNLTLMIKPKPKPLSQTEKKNKTPPKSPILLTLKAKMTSWPHAQLLTHTHLHTHSRGRWALPVLRGWLQLRHSWGTRLCHAALVVVGTILLFVVEGRRNKIERDKKVVMTKENTLVDNWMFLL